MKECKRIHKNFVAYLYGEVGEEEKERLHAHLLSCALCQSEVERLREIQQSADSLHPEIEKVMASVDWNTLPAQVTGAVFAREAEGRRESWLARFSQSIFKPALRPIYAGLVVGIVLGSLLTVMVLRTPLMKPEKRAQIYMPQEYIERVELEMARRETLDYLEKSQYLILDVVQDLSEEEPGSWQRSLTSQRAKDLLSKKKYINHQLDTFQMAKAKDICGQLQMLFYELSQMTDQVPAWRLKEILKVIEEKQILLKIKIIKKELEKSEKSEV